MTNSDSPIRGYLENVGMETAEALAAKGKTGDERTQTDNPLTYRKGLSELDELRQQDRQCSDRKEGV